MKRISLLILHLIILYFVFYFNLQTNIRTLEIEKPIYIEQISHIELNNQELSMNDLLRNKAYSLLNSYIGKSGDCYAIAKSFIKELKNFDDIQAEEINERDVICGDLIKYNNNGYGLTHFAVYIDTDIALHGSLVGGRCYLSKVNMKNMSKPVFYRVKEKTKWQIKTKLKLQKLN